MFARCLSRPMILLVVSLVPVTDVDKLALHNLLEG